MAQAHTSLASIRMYHLEGGDIEGEYQQAIALDPGYAQGIHWYALYLAATGRKEEAIREIKLAREIDPKSLIINANVGFVYYLAWEFDRAEAAEKTALQMDGYAAAGRKGDADEVLKELQSEQSKQFVSGYDFATAYAGFKDVRRTLESLQKAYAERNGRLANLAVHPQFAFLRNEPGFQNMVEKIWGTKRIREIK